MCKDCFGQQMFSIGRWNLCFQVQVLLVLSRKKAAQYLIMIWEDLWPDDFRPFRPLVELNGFDPSGVRLFSQSVITPYSIFVSI